MLIIKANEVGVRDRARDILFVRMLSKISTSLIRNRFSHTRSGQVQQVRQGHVVCPRIRPSRDVPVTRCDAMFLGSHRGFFDQDAYSKLSKMRSSDFE